VEYNVEDLVLWSDDTLLAVNKPAGLLVIRGGFDDSPYLTHMLEPAFGRVWVVHRLDRQTSGVLLFARTAEAHRSLNTQFQEHTTAKVYHALVNGDPPWQERAVEFPLRRDGDRRHRTVVDPGGGKPSLTHLRVLERFGRYGLVEAIPKTGRTHQIRAHLAALGLPVVADALYRGGQRFCLSDIAPDAGQNSSAHQPLIERVALHAHSLTIVHPTTRETASFEAPYAADFAVTLRALAAYRAGGH
jgi:tRNA pseudouridine32 synthase/23S rRNA pseudouridine746 synthase